MNFKNDKGIVAVDTTIAIIIMLIVLPVISGMIYNVGKNSKENTRKAEAIGIAVNFLESAKLVNLEGLAESIESDTGLTTDEAKLTSSQSQFLIEMKNNLNSIYWSSTDTTEITNNTPFAITVNEVQYKVTVTLKDYSEEEKYELNEKKDVTVNVEYPIGNKTDSINMKETVTK